MQTMSAGSGPPCLPAPRLRCWHSHRRLAAPSTNRRVEVLAIAIDTLPSDPDSPSSLLSSLGPRLIQQVGGAGVQQPGPSAPPARKQPRRRSQDAEPVAPEMGDRALEALAVSYLGPRSGVWERAQSPERVPQAASQDPSDVMMRLAQQGKFSEACDILRSLAAQPGPQLYRLSHKAFMRYAEQHQASCWALEFLRLLPTGKDTEYTLRLQPTYNMALMVCAASKDLATADRILQLAEERAVVADTMLLTSYIKVCKSLGDEEAAFRVYSGMKGKLPIDAHVVGAVVATCAEAMQLPKAQHDRKEKFVLMEKALGAVKATQEAGVRLSSEVWNSLVVCAGRCGQLKRAMELLDTMQLQGVRTDAYTYGGLMEACIESQRPELALRLFEQARHEGHVAAVELYTVAMSACGCLGGRVDWDRALHIYNLMQRSDVAPDSKFYAALITVAGLAGHLDYAFELLADMGAEGVRPDSSVCSALIAACCTQRQGPLARKVYNLCTEQGVYPGVSQYNRLMEWYGTERRFGDVVYLLTDMTQQAKLEPNLNTYRVLINACQRADQAALAFDILAIMRSKKIEVAQEKFAHAICYSLIKACHNMQRHILAQHNAHPAPWASASRMWNRPEVRLGEARQVLAALGSSLEARGSSSLLMQDPDVNVWAHYALSTYRTMLKGFRPNLSILDKMLACLRLPGSIALQYAVMSGITNSHSLNSSSNGNGLSVAGAGLPHAEGMQGDGASNAMQQQLLQAFKYQVAFERRAYGVMDEAISKGLLPSYSVDQACTIDLTGMPPTVAEVYTLSIMRALEWRAARARNTAGAESGAAGDAQLFFHKITLRVPPFHPQLVLWPSYVPRLDMRHSHQDASQSDSGDDRASSPSPDRHDHSSNSSLNGSGKGGRAFGSPAAAYAGAVAIEEDEDEEEEESMGMVGQQGPGGSLHQAAAAAAPSSTGLAVAATLRRLKFFARMQPAQGVISLETSEILQWVKAKRTWEMRLSGQLSVAGAPQGAEALRQRFSQASTGEQPVTQEQLQHMASHHQQHQQHHQQQHTSLREGPAGRARQPAQHEQQPLEGHVPTPTGGSLGLTPPLGPLAANPAFRLHMPKTGQGMSHNPAEQQRLIRLGMTTAAGGVGMSSPRVPTAPQALGVATDLAAHTSLDAAVEVTGVPHHFKPPAGLAAPSRPQQPPASQSNQAATAAENQP